VVKNFEECEIFLFFYSFFIHLEIIICTKSKGTFEEFDDPEITITKENWFHFYKGILYCSNSSELSRMGTQFGKFAREFAKESAKEYLQYIKDARDGLFTAFTFPFLASSSPKMRIFSNKTISSLEKINHLAKNFGVTCKHVLKSF
jgi:hypothetical protein